MLKTRRHLSAIATTFLGAFNPPCSPLEGVFQTPNIF